MLSKEDNELLSQTAAGTPMGNLIRRYWIPALLSEEIPAPDCAPARVRLLGEELVAFRDTQGRIGLIGSTARTVARHFFTGATKNAGCAASITAGSTTSRVMCSIPRRSRATVIFEKNFVTRPIRPTKPAA